MEDEPWIQDSGATGHFKHNGSKRVNYAECSSVGLCERQHFPECCYRLLDFVRPIWAGGGFVSS